MFDTMTTTKLGGGFLGALLIFLLGNWAADALYATAPDAHGDEHHAAGYAIAVGEEEAHVEEEVEEVSFADVMAAADADKGAKVFSKCKACHKLEDGVNSTGPSLFGIVGRDVAAVGDFGYSDALTALGGAWGPDELNGYLENPKTYAPGNKMSFAGLKKITDRANLIAYLQTIGG